MTAGRRASDDPRNADRLGNLLHTNSENSRNVSYRALWSASEKSLEIQKLKVTNRKSIFRMSGRLANYRMRYSSLVEVRNHRAIGGCARVVTGGAFSKSRYNCSALLYFIPMVKSDVKRDGRAHQ